MAPLGDKPWADGPLELIPTPKSKLDGAEEPPASKTATHMAIVHNILLRGANSIYNQAEHVPNDAVPAFLKFCSAWAYNVHSHHDNEEDTEFPLIGELTGDSNLMERNVVQHKEFLPGLKSFEEYVKSVQGSSATYDGGKIREILDVFGGSLRTHLYDEIETLTGLEKFDSFDWKKYHEVTHKASRSDPQGKLLVVPFMMTNHDTTFEGGIHGKFPPFPGFVHAIFQWWFVPKMKDAWEFSASDSAGSPRELKYSK